MKSMLHALTLSAALAAAAAVADGQGRVRANGFLGGYRVSTESGGRTASATFELKREMAAKDLRLEF